MSDVGDRRDGVGGGVLLKLERESFSSGARNLSLNVLVDFTFLIGGKAYVDIRNFGFGAVWFGLFMMF